MKIKIYKYLSWCRIHQQTVFYHHWYRILSRHYWSRSVVNRHCLQDEEKYETRRRTEHYPCSCLSEPIWLCRWDKSENEFKYNNHMMISWILTYSSYFSHSWLDGAILFQLIFVNITETIGCISRKRDLLGFLWIKSFDHFISFTVLLITKERKIASSEMTLGNN